MISGQSYNISIRFLNESIVEKKKNPSVFKCFQGRYPLLMCTLSPHLIHVIMFMLT